MKKRRTFLGLSIAFCSVVLVAVAYGFYVFNGNNDNKLFLDSLKESYIENTIEPEIKNDKILELSSIQKQCPTLRVTSGFESLNTYAERICYQKIKSGCNKVLDEKHINGCYAIAPITVEGYKLDSAQIKKVLYAVRNDYPELFWISSSFAYMYPRHSTVISLNSTFSRQDRSNAEERLNKKVSEIISRASVCKSDYEKELFFHDYLIANCKYESNYAYLGKDSRIYSSYGCLIDGLAVCEGYASAMQLLLNSVGIDARTVSGSSRNEPHMWNIVKIGNKWYHLDVTGDRSGEFQKYFYFNIDDSTVKLDHVINSQMGSQKWPEDKRYNFSLPVCNSKEHNYFEKNAFKFSSLNNERLHALTKHLTNLALKKESYLYIMVDKQKNAEELVKQENSLQGVFKCISSANKMLDPKYRMTNKSSIQYSICKPQNVIVIRLTYAYS